jgi:tetratricopeptide (TPR) repeat protein
MKLNLLIIIQIVVFLLLPLSAFAEIKTVTHTLKQPFGGSQSPDDARTAGIARAKREALEQFGTYIESTTVVKNAQVDSDEILALTAGVTKAEVIKQKNYTDGDAFGMEITVKVELDTAVLESSLKRLLEDRNHLKDLKDAREREKKLLARIAELETENQQKGKTKQQSAKLKKEFQAASQGLTAVEWVDKAMAVWDLENNSNPKKAIQYFTEAIRLDPNYAKAFNLRGLAYFELNQHGRAISDFDQVIRLNKNDAKIYSDRGYVYAHLKQFDRAIADYNQSISLDPDYADTYGHRGSAYGNLKQFERAIADFNHAISLDPNLEQNNAWLYRDRGLAYKMLEQFDRAIADFDQAILINPKDTEAYNRRGRTYVELKQFDRAVSDFDQSIKLNSNNAIAYNYRGVAYGELKQFSLAMADFDEAIRLDQKYAWAYSNRGFLYLDLNSDKKACADLKKACTLELCSGYKYARQENRCSK